MKLPVENISHSEVHLGNKFRASHVGSLQGMQNNLQQGCPQSLHMGKNCAKPIFLSCV